MLFRVLKWLLLTLLVMVIALAGYMQFSASRALDHERAHATAAAQLPFFTPNSPDGLVRIAANNMEFRARIAGFDRPNPGPLVVMLHGFPVSSAMYTDLIAHVAGLGYRVLAPDQRGYSPGARPLGSEHYQIDYLYQDLFALVDVIGDEQFHLVGHDWGAVVGWYAVLNKPERIVSWSGLSIAHPAAFGYAIENDPEQKRRSSYFFLFATPWLAETLFSMRDFALVREMATVMSAEQQREYLALLSEPGALTAAFNWYRAIMVQQPKSGDLAQTTSVPTVFLWGNHDESVARSGVEQQAQYMKGPYTILELDAGHWLLRDQPEKVIGAISRHIQTWSTQPAE